MSEKFPSKFGRQRQPRDNGKQLSVACPKQGICGQSARYEQMSIDIADTCSD
jgi:hypothetical protein